MTRQSVTSVSDNHLRHLHAHSIEHRPTASPPVDSEPSGRPIEPADVKLRHSKQSAQSIKRGNLEYSSFPGPKLPSVARDLYTDDWFPNQTPGESPTPVTSQPGRSQADFSDCAENTLSTTTAP